MLSIEPSLHNKDKGLEKLYPPKGNTYPPEKAAPAIIHREEQETSKENPKPSLDKAKQGGKAFKPGSKLKALVEKIKKKVKNKRKAKRPAQLNAQEASPLKAMLKYVRKKRPKLFLKQAQKQAINHQKQKLNPQPHDKRG